MDRLTTTERSRNMRAIRSHSSRPELLVRSLLHRLGFRYRLHRHDLPGRPDIVLAKYRAVIFVHGCFWHCHTCIDGHVPKSRPEYWPKKLAGNVQRDKRNIRQLRVMGWRVHTVWECQTDNPEKLSKRLSAFLLLR
jgi:DNA mismatch endonuclease (patch repair protein)